MEDASTVAGTDINGVRVQLVLFCSHQDYEPNHYGSNWYPSRFTVDDVEYNCGEQYMMAEKARQSGDAASLAKIMNSTDPREMKDLGRGVTGFSAQRWSDTCEDIMYRGLLCKFSQNIPMKKWLLDTGDAIIAEAAHYDSIWGIGLRSSDPRALSQKTWLGKNLLGKILMRVRKELIAKEME